jgi:hypothetical protein
VDFVAVARAVSKRIVRRLEPIEKELSFPTGYYVGDREAEEKLREQISTGRVSLQAALRNGRAALSSDDPEIIVIRALVCQTSYGSGRFLSFKHEEAALLAREHGKRSGETRRTKMEDRVKPYRDRYRAMLDLGVRYLQARKECIDQMTADRVPVPKSATTINRMFPKPYRKIQ